FQRALPLRPAPQVQVAYHTERGRALYRAEKYGDALKACQAALQLAPDDASACGLQAQILLDQKRYAEATGSFSRYLENGGKPSAAIFRGRGLARLHTGDLRGALEDYTRALRLRLDAEVYTLRGWAYVFNKEWQPALHDFEEAIRRDPPKG